LVLVQMVATMEATGKTRHSSIARLESARTRAGSAPSKASPRFLRSYYIPKVVQ
ncbi:hypothetical protein LCGC14_2776300, partial [marine sediment metagenome]